MLTLSFDIRLFLTLSLAFILSTIIGTVTHEYGHYTVAKTLGYSSSVGYGYTTWEDNKSAAFIDSIYSKYPKELANNLNFPEKKEFDLIQSKQTKDGFWITLGGPLQTMLTGTIGLLLLQKQRKKILVTKSITGYQWLYIFLSLFWLRQVANLITCQLGYLFTGQFSLNGDEIRLALDLNLSKESITVATAILGLVVLIFILFYVIPIDKRITFISAGLFGGVLGYLFWLIWVGPILMP